MAYGQKPAAAGSSTRYADKSAQGQGGAPTSVKTHNLSFRKKGAPKGEKGVAITGLFRDDGKNFSTITVTRKILDTLSQVSEGDKIYLFSQEG
jgi:hypothetical protein